MALLSIDDVIPDEEGGPNARIGFNYQDEIAVGFLLEMLESKSIIKIHCETHDDIVLVHEFEPGLRVAEYVQVKANELGKLWSVADISTRKMLKVKDENHEENIVNRRKQKGKEASSIFETSLGHDKHEERSIFRLVTLSSVDKDLKPLTYPCGAPGREKDSREFMVLSENLSVRFPMLLSPKNNGIDYWLENCYWEVRHDEKAVINNNRLKIIGLCYKRGVLPEQAFVLLDELRLMAKDAGSAKWKPDKFKKIITKNGLIQWFESRILELLEGVKGSAGIQLRKKLTDANLSAIIPMASDLRRAFSDSRLNPRYMAPDEREVLQYRVKSEVATLHAKFLATDGENSIEFHASCIERMDEINRQRVEGSEDVSAYLKGCMYDITDRCFLRFNKPKGITN